jgi:uncharacterized protein (TIGR02301 family)
MPCGKELWLVGALLLATTAQSVAQDTAPEPAPGASPEAPAEAPPAPASEPPPPIYEDQLLRLSEVLGSLSFLRPLCGASDGAAWRDEMSALLAAEHPGEDRRRRLIGRFNHGFETLNAVYRSCTSSAELAISRYLTEGQALANDVRSRYGQ